MSRKPIIPIWLKLFLLFTLFPLLELYLLVWLAQNTSLGFTILLVIFTGVLGATLARREGFYTMQKVQASFGRGVFPGDHLLDGLLILVGGVLLVTPGLLTDLIGCSTLLAPCRAVYRKILKKAFAGKVKTSGFGQQGGFHVHMGSGGDPFRRREQPADQSTNGTSQEVDEDREGSPFEDTSPFAKKHRE